MSDEEDVTIGPVQSEAMYALGQVLLAMRGLNKDERGILLRRAMIVSGWSVDHAPCRPTIEEAWIA